MIPAVVPVKELAASKSRLFPHLGREADLTHQSGHARAEADPQG